MVLNQEAKETQQNKGSRREKKKRNEKSEAKTPFLYGKRGAEARVDNR